MTFGTGALADDAPLPATPGRTSTNRRIAAITDPWEHPRTAVSVAIMCEWAAEHGIPAEPLLRGSHLDRDSPTDVEASVEASQEMTVAQHLHYAPRTLRRHLEHEGTTFRTLLDEARRSVAENLLRARTSPHSEFARRLGYRDWSSVVRARRRWRRM